MSVRVIVMTETTQATADTGDERYKGFSSVRVEPGFPHFPVQHRVSLGLNHLASVIFSNPVLVSMNPNTQTLNRHDVEDLIW